MTSMMMQPASSESDVATQYGQIKNQLCTYLDSLMRITQAAMYAMPRTSVFDKPNLYSGQVAISNLGEAAMATYFEEYSGNSGPVGTPMGMPIDDALQGFMAPGNTLTLKSFIGFTDSAEDAQHYSNGLILEMSRRPDSAVWKSMPKPTTSLNSEASYMSNQIL